jgi:hypothetical protein
VSVGDECETALRRERLHRRAQLAEQHRRVERLVGAPLVAGLQAGEADQVVEKRSHGRHAALQLCEGARARIVRGGLAVERHGRERHYAEAAAQIVRGSAHRLGPVRLERLERLERLHELALASRRFAPLQLLVLIGALAHAVAAQLRERAARGGHRLGGGPGVRERVGFQLVDEAQVQVAPLPHRLALPVTLLPAVHPVARRAFALVLGGIRPLFAVAGTEHPLERV